LDYSTWAVEDAKWGDVPADGSVWLTGHCSQRMLRGGSWATGPSQIDWITDTQQMRSASRIFRSLSLRDSSIGFRVARANGSAPPIVAHLPGSTFRDCMDVCPEMVAVSPGNFWMGSPSTEPDRSSGEDHHVVRIQYAFAVERYDVTRAEFARFVGETHYVHRARPLSTGPDLSVGCLLWSNELFTDGEVRDDVKGGKERTFPVNKDWNDPGFQQTDRDPVVCVDSADAEAYVAWLSQKTGKQYRLLSEAEWEYSSRAGTTTARYWGDQIGRDNANYGSDDAGNPFADGRDQWEYTSPVGSFAPNKFGLYDMLGNVSQLVEDCWHGRYDIYGETTFVRIDDISKYANNDGSAWREPLCASHVTRGGGWFNRPGSIRSAARRPEPLILRLPTIGFRVARTLE